MSKHNDNTQLDDLKELFKARIIQEKLTKITDMPFSFMDLDGNWIGKPSSTNYSVFKLVNANEVGREKCLECDRKHKNIALVSGKAVTYVSQTGLINFVVPIKINGRNMGVIIGGQVLPGEIDDTMRDTLKDVAKDLQIDEREFLIAAKEIQIKKKPELDNAIKMIEEMVPFICELELEKVEEKRNRIKKDEQITSLQEVGMAITSNLDLRQVLGKIVKSAKEVLNADVATIYLYEQKTNELKYPPLIEGHINHKQTMEHPMKKDDVLYKILKETQSYFADNAVNDRIMYNKSKKGNSFVVRENIKASAGLPLRIGHETVGVLFVNYRIQHQFNSDEKRIVKLFASQAAVAIQNAKLYEQTHEKLKEKTEKLNILYEVGEEFSSTFEINHILDLLLEKGKDLTGAQKATARLLDSDTNMLLPCARKGKTNAKSLNPIIIGKGILGAAAKEKRAVLVPDVENDDRYICFNKETRSELAIPMLWGKEKELVGVLNFEHPQINAFSKDDKKLLETLADSAAIAVENAKLYNNLNVSYKTIVEDQKMVIDTIHDIERSMTSDKFKLIELLKRIRDRIVGLVDAKHGCILGLDDDENLINILLCCRIKNPKNCKERMDKMMVYEALEKHNIVISPDIKKDDKYKRGKGWPETRSELVFPVTDEDNRVICILTLSSNKTDAFGMREKRLAELFAELIAVTLKDARRIMRLNERNKWLTFLFDVIIDIKKEQMELDEIFRHIVKFTSEIFHVDDCSLYILDETSKKITLRASLQDSRKFIEKRISFNIGEGITGWMVQTGESIREKSIKLHQYWEEKFEKVICKKIPDWKCRSFLGVPLKVGKKCIGTIQLHNRNPTEVHSYDWFSKEEEELLLALGEIIAFAIDKARIISEKETLQTEKMAAIGRLTAGATHSFKQPMQIIKNQVDRLKREQILKPYLEEIGTIDNQIHRMNEIINVFSRFSSPRIEKNIDVNKLIKQSFKEIRIPKKIRIIIEDNNNLKVNCDPGQIQTVFENLIFNACEAMKARGDLEISTSTNSEMINIAFKDSGEGIPDYAREKVFDPFFTTKKSKGTGLGLYISQFIIQNHKGDIHFKTEEGKGTIFTVELPASKKA